MTSDYITPIKELENKIWLLRNKKDTESNVMRKFYFKEIEKLEQKYIYRWNEKMKRINKK